LGQWTLTKKKKEKKNQVLQEKKKGKTKGKKEKQKRKAMGVLRDALEIRWLINLCWVVLDELFLTCRTIFQDGCGNELRWGIARFLFFLGKPPVLQSLNHKLDWFFWFAVDQLHHQVLQNGIDAL
jgi:hypothetical protein